MAEMERKKEEPTKRTVYLTKCSDKKINRKFKIIMREQTKESTESERKLLSDERKFQTTMASC